MKILMLCLGNICRSPLAEGILQHKCNLAGLDWTIDSAGTNGFHNGQSPHHLSQKIARINGIDISRQVSRRIQKTDLRHYDKIYAMAADVLEELNDITGYKQQTQNVELFLNTLYPGENRDVPDPWYGGEQDYHDAYVLIEKACDAIIENHLSTGKQTLKH